MSDETMHPEPETAAEPEMTGAGSPAARVAHVVPTRSWKRRLIGGAFVLAVAGGALTLVGIALSQEAPAWWSAIDARDPEVLAAAQRVENGAATQLTKIRQQSDEIADGSSAPWTVALKASDANAWLATRLGKWLESQEAEADASGRKVAFRWPRELGQVQVRFEGGVIGVGASVRSTGKAAADQSESVQVLTASIRPELRTDGSLWMPAGWVSLGRLSVPAAWMLPSGAGAKDQKHASVANAAAPESLRDLPQTRDMLAVFSGEMPAMKRPVIRIGDGRRVELLRLEPRDGVLLITCRTLPREQNTASSGPAK